MSRGPSRIRKTDITRLIRAVEAAGATVTGIEVDGEKIRVMTGKPVEDNTTAFDKWKASHAN